jgi:hypothetical protein
LAPPDFLRKTCNDPKLATQEILRLLRKDRSISDEKSKALREAAEHRCSSARLGRELKALRIQHQLLQNKSKFVHEQMQKSEDRARRKACHLESQVRELEAKLLAAQAKVLALAAKRGSGSSLDKMTVIKKLASNRTIGKRLAAAVHPDKVPSELSEPAADVFRFLQAIREQSENGCSG